MSGRSLVQRRRLINLAVTILKREKPLGVGLRNECWAGLAIEVARQRRFKSTEYYGISMSQGRKDLKLNNRLPPAIRNFVMAGSTIVRALT